MATPCPGSPGCQCPYCYGLREYMLAETGRDYGLPRTYRPVRVERPPEPKPIVLTPKNVRQPWEPRPARRAA